MGQNASKHLSRRHARYQQLRLQLGCLLHQQPDHVATFLGQVTDHHPFLLRLHLSARLQHTTDLQ